MQKGSYPTVEEIHGRVKELFHHDFSGYYVTSLYSAVNGMISSQKELLKQYRDDRNNRVANRKMKIAQVKGQLTGAINVKKQIVGYHKINKKYPSQIQSPAFLMEKYPDPEMPDFQQEAYAFECWLDLHIKTTKARLHQIQEKRRKDEAKVFNIPPQNYLRRRQKVLQNQRYDPYVSR